MNKKQFDKKVKKLFEDHKKLITKKNLRINKGNGIYFRYKNPIITAQHTPITWRYDLNYKSNPYLMERLGINCTFNSGAIEHNGKILLGVRVEGHDRKSFFAIAESKNGVDNFRFWDYPITMPETENPDTNVYDMRLVKHEDGWIYGIFCAERKDPSAASGDLSSAIAAAGIVRTRDMLAWERLPDLKSASQQRNVVLHPEFIRGKYALYTRPQEGFIEAGKGGGIGWALIDDMTHAQIGEEKMSKSLGNMPTIKEALAKNSSDALRVFILSGQYRSPLSLSDEGLKGAGKGAERLSRAVNRKDSSTKPDDIFDTETYRKQFIESMDDDFNTAQGLSILFDLARALNQAADSGINITEARKLLKELAGEVMGLRLDSSEAETGMMEAAPFIDLMVKTRFDLRQAKQYQLADEIRIKLSEMGIILEDTPKGTIWKNKKLG